MKLFNSNWWDINNDAELRFYFRAAKKSKVEFCELSYRIRRNDHKSTIIRHRLSHPKTQQDLDMLIIEAKSIYANARGVNINDIKILKNQKF